MRRFWIFTLCATLLGGAQLKPDTDRFYESYVFNIDKTLQKRRQFLLTDTVAGLRERVKEGEIFVEERRPRSEPPSGLIHHWEGAVFVPKVNIGQVLQFVQNYDNHKNVYGPEVIESQTLKRTGNEFQIRLRLLKKKIVTVVLETEHAVRYKQVDPQKWESVSMTTKVSELKGHGSATPQELPPGAGFGFVWHMNSFWRFQEADGGVYLECTSISLSRDIPFGMARLIRPIVEELPEQSLLNVLRNTRKFLLQRH